VVPVLGLAGQWVSWQGLLTWVRPHFLLLPRFRRCRRRRCWPRRRGGLCGGPVGCQWAHRLVQVGMQRGWRWETSLPRARGVCCEDGGGDLAALRCRLSVCPENGGGDFAASGGCVSSEDGGGGSLPRSGVPLAPCMARCEHSQGAAVVGEVGTG